MNVVYKERELSRTDLVDRTKYSAFLVSKMCDELLAAGLIRETGLGNSTGGRPPTLLSINPEIGRVVGVHIGTFNTRIVVTDLAGGALAFRKVASHVEVGPEIALAGLISEVEATLAEAGVELDQVRGIGIGISGVLERSTGTTLFWPKVPQWTNVPVKRRFAQRFRTAIEVEDTPRTMALAERRFGQGSQASEFVYISLGAGTGAALFLHDQLYTGADGFAGEFGHLMLDAQGPLCSCGNRGCLEATLSASALIRRAEAAVSQRLSTILWRLTGGDPAKTSVELIGQAAQEGDRFSRSLLREAGAFLGLGLVGIINLLNPSLIVIGGSLAIASGRFLLAPVEEAIRDRALVNQAAEVRVQLSELGEVDWARGAALLVINQALEISVLDRLAQRQTAPANSPD
jgi:N-acetylglucosamine repressor